MLLLLSMYTGQQSIVPVGHSAKSVEGESGPFAESLPRPPDLEFPRWNLHHKEWVRMALGFGVLLLLKLRFQIAPQNGCLSQASR
jgi:hypothetical protein